MKWIDNINNEVGYLNNKDNYVSVNEGLNETALRVKFQDTGKSINDYQTFIVMGNHKETVDNMNSDLEIMEWFVKNTDGLWTNDVELLKDYISDNFTKQQGGKYEKEV